jgi:regulation of enolase protein 1 (concanavalin A-like superfamily)
MKPTRRLNMLAFAFVASTIVAPGSLSVGAQSGAPSVNIRRMTSLNDAVFTGDFNGDGIIDVVSQDASSTSRVVVALGKGDGTFGGATPVGCTCRVLAVADLDNDRKLDLLVVALPEPNGQVRTLRGNGDGTFSVPANSFTVSSWFVQFGLIADIDNDGTNDVLIDVLDDRLDESIIVYRGNGDFTMTFERSLVSGGANALSAVVADLNGDAKPDIVVTNHDGRSISIFRGQGGFNFTAADIPLGEQANDVVATDVNHDGKMDLLVATSTDAEDDFFYTDGSVMVLRGNGDGTFQSPIPYATGRGAWRIVVGDFNRDGIPDVATANRSGELGEDVCGNVWDSVSILPGRSDGTFAAASTFSLGNQATPGDRRFQNSVRSLAVADLNRDGAPDLVASFGAILLNHAPDTNWPPTVSAGVDQTLNVGESIVFQASASDVDQDMLTYAWSDSGGHEIEMSPSPCSLTPDTPGVYTMTVTVDDGHGHLASDSFTYTVNPATPPPSGPTVSIVAPTAGEVVAAGQAYPIRWTASAGSDSIARFDVSYSVDDGATSQPIPECQEVSAFATSCEWANPPVTEQARVTVAATDRSGHTGAARSARFTIRTAPGTPLGNGWAHDDVGHVNAAGEASFDGLVLNGEGYTVSGSGSDIWGTADAFHFAWKQMAGDFSIDTQVESIENTSTWAKAGLMIRANALDVSSPHASIFVSPGNGIAFQRRVAQGGVSTNTAGPALTAPVWLRLTRQGTMIQAMYRKNLTDAWTTLKSQTIDSLGGPVDVGLAVTSHRTNAELATAKFKGVYLAPIANLEASWYGGASGSYGGDGTTVRAHSSGSDIWGTSDSYLFAAMPIGDNRQITVRVRALDNTNVWAKAGVMIRESLAEGSKHADAIVSPGKGIAMQYRSATGGASASAVQMNGAAPIWLRIRRFEAAGPTATGAFSSWFSTDGLIWRRLGDVNFNIAHDAYIGIAVTSHQPGIQTVAVIDDIRVER